MKASLRIQKTDEMYIIRTLTPLSSLLVIDHFFALLHPCHADRASVNNKSQIWHLMHIHGSNMFVLMSYALMYLTPIPVESLGVWLIFYLQAEGDG